MAGQNTMHTQEKSYEKKSNVNTVLSVDEKTSQI